MGGVVVFMAPNPALQIRELDFQPHKIPPGRKPGRAELWKSAARIARCTHLYGLPSFLIADETMLREQWAKLHGVLLEAYSPLGSSKQVKETLELPIVGDPDLADWA